MINDFIIYSQTNSSISSQICGLETALLPGSDGARNFGPFSECGPVKEYKTMKNIAPPCENFCTGTVQYGLIEHKILIYLNVLIFRLSCIFRLGGP